MKKASIVIHSFNRLEYLINTLYSFWETIDYDNFELIVVDNGSVSGNSEYLIRMAELGKIHKLILLDNDCGNQKGFNIGFAYADKDTDFLIVLDPDMKILSKGWLRNFIRIFEENPDIGLLALNQENHTGLMNLSSQIIGSDELMNMNQWICTGGCMTIPKKIFNLIGYFDEDLPKEIKQFSLWDIEYVKRVTIKGFKSFYVKNLFSHHQFWLDNKIYNKYNEKKSKFYKSNNELIYWQKYETGERSVAIHYEKYNNYLMPPDRRVIKLYG